MKIAGKTDLVWMGQRVPPDWPLGDVHPVEEDDLGELARSVVDAEAYLFWDDRCGDPDPDLVAKLLERPVDVFHAGLRLGTSGQPGIIDFVKPTWMFNRDPDPEIEATSWRLTLRACLIKTSAWQFVGGLDPSFDTLQGASLELGHRCIVRGIVIRHRPDLVSGSAPQGSPTLRDEVRFMRARFGVGWSCWALLRALSVAYRERAVLLTAWTDVMRERPSGRVDVSMVRNGSAPALAGQAFTTSGDHTAVSVVIPTVDRYPYLRVLLTQLGDQTLQPSEILLVDQTPQHARDEGLAGDFPNLPLRVLYLDSAGQCSSRNAALEQANGDFVLLCDDDIEVAPSFIEDHLAVLRALRADASSGVANEVGAGPLSEEFRRARLSDVFPGGVTLLRREMLVRTGLFDLAFEHGARADADLGMRAYLAGALTVLSPHIRVLHHRAPRGGLRKHDARVVTYASSRMRLLDRHLPSESEIYLAKRYFSPAQVREMLWLRAAGTLRARHPAKAAAKILVGLAMLPDTLRTIRRRVAEVDRRIENATDIPEYVSQYAE